MRLYASRLTATLLLISLLTLGLDHTAYAVPLNQPSPPMPPARFYGTVQLDGTVVEAGTPIKAVIDGNVCGTTISELADGASIYSIDVAADDLLAPQPVCGREGVLVTFLISGQPAQERPLWASGAVTELNLSAAREVTATATPTTTPLRRPVSIPEPATWMLLGLGLSGLLAGLTRFRKPE